MAETPEERRDAQTFQPTPGTGSKPPFEPTKRHETYEVQKGDTLQSIAQKFYDDSAQWRRIWDANDGIIDEPDDIYPGQELKIPELRREV